MKGCYQNITDLIGNTPIFEIPHEFHGTNNKILVKLDYYNPTGSLKDRITIRMVEDAEKAGKINKETLIIEPTSGNTGISLAFICSIKKYQLVLTMSEAMSSERRRLIAYYGAKIVLTRGELGFQGTIDKANEINQNNKNSIVLNQYFNPRNFITCKEETGKEVFDKTLGDVDILINGVGTGASISGISAYFKERRQIHTIAIEPFGNNILSGGSNYNSHALQGIGPNFIPGNFKKEYIDEIFHVKKEQAFEYAKKLTKIGVFGGISTGANAYCAFQKAKEVSNKTIFFLACDRNERYISCDLFD